MHKIQTVWWIRAGWIWLERRLNTWIQGWKGLKLIKAECTSTKQEKARHQILISNGWVFHPVPKVVKILKIFVMSSKNAPHQNQIIDIPAIHPQHRTTPSFIIWIQNYLPPNLEPIMLISHPDIISWASIRKINIQKERGRSWKKLMKISLHLKS